jgi:hypothetical protein
MEFKGTKGNWKLAQNEYGYFTSVRNIDDTRKICTSRVNNQIESNANLLLISKAPEMLEMLHKIKLTLKRYGEIEEFKEIEQLIKEATEI